MTEFEKKAAIKQLQLIIDKQLAFFRIITDAGNKSPVASKPVPKQK